MSDKVLAKRISRWKQVLDDTDNTFSTTEDKYRALRKLSNVIIDFCILQSTGIGRSVNQVRSSDNSEVRALADDLILKWKCIVDEYHSKMESMNPGNANSNSFVHIKNEPEDEPMQEPELPIVNIKVEPVEGIEENAVESMEEVNNPTEVKRSESKCDAQNSLDNSAGLSFADALGISDSSSNLAKVVKKRPKSNHSLKKHIKSEESKLSSSTECDSSVFKVPLPKNKKRKLNPSELEELSSKAFKLDSVNPPVLNGLSTDYRPSNTVFSVMSPSPGSGSKLQKTSTSPSSAGLCLPIKANSRTRVFSGVKSVNVDSGPTTASSLKNLCLDFLGDNIAYIRELGPMVAYHIIEPVLERATVDQLRRLEHYNPHLLEDTHALWKKHLEHDFRTERNSIPEDTKNWRKIYHSLAKKQKVRLEQLSAKIQAAKDAEKPKNRQTKLAFMAEAAKPPRSVRRQQAKYGTGVRSDQAQHPYMKLSSRHQGTTNTTNDSSEAGSKISDSVPRQFVRSLPEVFAENSSITCDSPRKQAKRSTGPLMLKARQLAKKLKHRS